MALPDDLLAGILGRLPARSLAASRGVCKAWRDLVDERELLLRLRFVLPHTVRGLFINYQDYGRSHFLSRPTSTSSPGHQIDGKFDFVQREESHSWTEVLDHCNGLVLFLERDPSVLHVCNPITRWSSRLPPWPGGGAALRYTHWDWGRRAFLVFDPSVSPEYKVLLSPGEPVSGRRRRRRKKQQQEEEDDDTCRLRLMEWPPSAWTSWLEFSSTTRSWEEKVLVREGEAAGTVGDLMLNEDGYGGGIVEPPCRYAAYWKGALYVHFPGEFVARLSLLDDKYTVIKSPVQLAERKNDGVQSFLGRSEKGVYIAAMASDAMMVKLRVWTLSEEPGDQAEWVPKDQSRLEFNAYSLCSDRNKFHASKCWVLDIKQPKYQMPHHDNESKNQDVSLEERNVSWNSDDDNIVDGLDDEQGYCGYVQFLGFHPYKEVIFLCRQDGDAAAFHLNTRKLQYLGILYLYTYNRGIRESFVYTPCLIGN